MDQLYHHLRTFKKNCDELEAFIWRSVKNDSSGIIVMSTVVLSALVFWIRYQ